MQRNWKQILLSVDCHNRVRPDLPNKQEQIHIQYALLTYGNMPVQPRFRVKFLLKFKYENVVRLAFQKKFYSKTRMDGHITIREKSVYTAVERLFYLHIISS